MPNACSKYTRRFYQSVDLAAPSHCAILSHCATLSYCAAEVRDRRISFLTEVLCVLIVSAISLLFGETSHAQDAANERNQEEPATIVAPEAAGEPSAVADESNEPEATDTPSLPEVEQAILPLDPWKGPAVQSTPTVDPRMAEPLPGITPEPEPTPWQWKETGDTPTISRRRDLLVDESTTILNRQQRRRIERIQKRIRQQTMKVFKERHSAIFSDPRGEPEFRFCAVNLNNFGVRKEVGRLLKSAGLRGYVAKRNSVVRGISTAQCDVVAIQGLIGRDFITAKRGLDEITSRVKKRTDRPWESYVAMSEKELGYNGFLLASDRVAYIESRTHGELPLMRFANEEDQQLRRALFEIQFRVNTKEGSKVASDLTSRRFVAFSTQFQHSLTGNVSESDRLRWQIADAVRQQIIRRVREERSKDPIDLPSFAVGAALVGSQRTGVQYVLDGRRRVSDLMSGACKFVEVDEKGRPLVATDSEEGEPAELSGPGSATKTGNKKSRSKKATRGRFAMSCPRSKDGETEAGAPRVRPHRYQQLLFSVLHTPPPPAEVVKVARRRSTKRTSSAQTSEFKMRPASRKAREMYEIGKSSTEQIYVTAADLPLAARTDSSKGGSLYYRTGQVNVKNGLANSPLVWVDFNW